MVQVEITLFVVMRPDGGSDVMSDESELLGAIKAAPDGCAVRAVRIKVDMPAPGKATAAIEAMAADNVVGLPAAVA